MTPQQLTHCMNVSYIVGHERGLFQHSASCSILYKGNISILTLSVHLLKAGFKIDNMNLVVKFYTYLSHLLTYPDIALHNKNI
jgi:hypothetical protein